MTAKTLPRTMPRDLRVEQIARQLRLELDPWQVGVLRSEHPRVLLNCCRQAGKSTIVALLALLEAMTVQKHLVIILSRSQRQSRLLFDKVGGFLDQMPLDSVKRCARSREMVVFPNLSRIIALPCKEETIRGPRNSSSSGRPASGTRLTSSTTSPSRARTVSTRSRALSSRPSSAFIPS